MSLPEFQAYWRDEHGPLVARHQKDMGIVRYVQEHRLATAEADAIREAAIAARGGTMVQPFDGVSNYWFNSEADYRQACRTPPGAAADARIIADEKTFIDHANSSCWFANEYPQVNTSNVPIVAAPLSGIVKIQLALRQLPSMSDDEGRDYWLHTHGALVRETATARGLLRYQQVHRQPTPLTAEVCANRGIGGEHFLGHAEAWVDLLSKRGGSEADIAASANAQDERNFIDLSRSSYWLSKELMFVDRRWATAGL